MAYKGIPDNIIGALSPMDLVGYLVSTGWQKIDRVKGEIALFRREKSSEIIDVAVPLDCTFSDYSLRMAEAIESVAEGEGVSVTHLLGIFLRSINGNGDVLTSRLRTSSDKHNGLPDLRSASSILVKLAKAVEIASEFERDISEQSELIAPFRLAHSRAGSYCFDVVAPITNKDDTQSQISRRTVERIMRGISFAEKATIEQTPSPLICNAADGFDANLCKIFAEFCEELTDFDVDFSVSFSAIIENPQPVGNPRLTEESAQYLWAAADAIRRELEEHGTITGGVLECHDKSRIPGGRDGSGRRRVRVSFSDPDLGLRNRIVTAYVNEADYQKALLAHNTRHLVKISGIINKTTGRWIINSTESFEILEEVISQNENSGRSRGAQVEPATPRVLRPQSGASLIHKLRDAVDQGLIPRKFTRSDYYDWINQHDIRHPGGRYAWETIRKTLDNYCVGSTSGTGGPKGALRRTTEIVDGKAVSYFEFVE